MTVDIAALKRVTLRLARAPFWLALFSFFMVVLLAMLLTMPLTALLSYVAARLPAKFSKWLLAGAGNASGFPGVFQQSGARYRKGDIIEGKCIDDR
jgi:hypothetical protein